jgi:hypothetical protein
VNEASEMTGGAESEEGETDAGDGSEEKGDGEAITS